MAFLLKAMLLFFSYLACVAALRMHGGESTISRRLALIRTSAAVLPGGEDSNHLHSAQLPFSKWLVEVFKDQHVSPLYIDPTQIDAILNTAADMGCIIDEPTRTMARPMIDFVVEEATQEVISTSNDPPNPRSKRVVTIARGMGGGKTRAMEEIRRNLLRRKSTLPFGITFNNDSEISSDPWLKSKFRKQILNRKKIRDEGLYALSVCARVLSATFGVPYSKEKLLIDDNLHRLDWESTDAVTMIRETLKFVTRCVNEAREASSVERVDTVVLLMDESLRADTFLDDDDFGKYVRQALLNENLGFHAALVISDLGFLPDDLSTPFSSRSVAVLELPARLCSEKIVSTWWFPPDEPIKLTPEQQNFFELIAASLNNMPRAVEIAVDFLRVEANKEEFAVDLKTLFNRLFEHISNVALARYTPVAPHKEVLFAAFFREKVALDKMLLESFMRSVVTNPLSKDAFRKGSFVVPDVSLVLLNLLALSSSDKDTSVKLIGESIRELLDTMSLSYRDTGDVLETAVLQALKVRLMLAFNVEEITLARLCGLSKVFGREQAVKELKLFWSANVNVATAEAMFAPLGTNWYSNKVDVLHHDSHKDSAAFLAELDSFQVSEQLPVRILRPNKQEAWDMCVVSYNSVTKKPFYVFFDCKSGPEFSDSRSNKYMLNTMANPVQYRHTRAMMGSSRDFLFVYLMTHEKLATEVVSAENEKDKDLASRCIFLDRFNTLELLGPFSEIYQVARSSYSRSLDSSADIEA